MNTKLRPLALVLVMSFTAKVAIIGGSWQEVVSLGLLSMVALFLQGVNDDHERKEILKQVDKLKKDMAKSKKLQEDNSSTLTALKMNNGITTRRL